MVKAYMFDCCAEQIIMDFQNESEAHAFAANRGLEIWKIEEI